MGMLDIGEVDIRFPAPEVSPLLLPQAARSTPVAVIAPAMAVRCIRFMMVC
jgi:hypothetical protein